MTSMSHEVRVRLSGNQRLPLDDPARAWRIQAGSLAVFMRAGDGDVTTGPPRLLFAADAGSVLFGCAPGPSGIVLTAVALEDAELLATPLARTPDAPVGEGAPERPDVLQWVRRLAAAIGQEDVTALADGVLVPERADLPDVLGAYHTRFLEAFGEVRRVECEDQRRALADREADRERLTEESLRTLARAARVTPDAAVFTATASPLVAAFRAATRDMGITVIEPATAGGRLEPARQPYAIAAASRFRIRQVRLAGDWWTRDVGSLVGFLRDGGAPVGLVPLPSGHYELCATAAGRALPVDRQMAETLAPTAYAIYRPFRGGLVNPRDLIRFGLRGQRSTIRTIVAAGVLGALLAMTIPVATGVLIDAAIPDANRALLVQLAAGLCVAVVGKSLFDLVQSYSIVRLESASSHATQAAVWDRLLSMRPAFFRRFTTGDLAARSLGVTQVHRRLSGAMLRTVLGGGAALLNLGLMIAYSARLALVAVAAALLAGAVTLVSGRRTLSSLRLLQALEGRLFGLTVQLIQGVSTLRVAASEHTAFACWARKYGEQQTLKVTVQRLQDGLRVSNEVVPVACTALLFWFGYAEMNRSDTATLTTGTFLAFSAAFGVFFGGITSLGDTAVALLEDVSLFERARPILEAEPEVGAGKADPGRVAGRVVVDHATFRYRQDGPLTLEDVSLEAAAGEFVAIVGPSGSGKSTLLRLLLGFETPESGTVYYDGQDLLGLDVSALRRQLGVVLQNSSIMAGPIRDNIIAGGAATLDEAWAAARAAGLEDDLRAFPMGMFTMVSEGGTNLSGGQRQRLLIARALAGSPRVILFDEATSALDNRTQGIVAESLDRLHITRIVIAHRLSTVQTATRIYVIENGRVVQQGSFRDLSRQEGLFARMMARQML